MPLYLILEDGESNLLHTVKVGVHTILVTEAHSRVATHCVTVTHTTAATSVVIRPRKGGALVVTDVLVSGEKINGGKVTVQFQDGTDQAIIDLNHVTDGPVNLHAGFEGRIRGWIDARIEFITDTTNQDATVLVAYYFINGVGAISREDWLTERSGAPA